MHLFAPEDFADRYSISIDVADFRSAIEAASESATSVVAGWFRYRHLDAQSGVRDVFTFDRAYGTAGYRYTRLLLSRGLLKESSVRVRAAQTYPLLTGQTTAAGRLLDLRDLSGDGASDFVTVDAELGEVTIHQIDPTLNWVGVEYDAGLTVNSDGVYEGAPEWLREAAILQAVLNLAPSRVIVDENALDMTETRRALHRVWENHARVSLSAYQPVSSTLV